LFAKPARDLMPAAYPLFFHSDTHRADKFAVDVGPRTAPPGSIGHEQTGYQDETVANAAHCSDKYAVVAAKFFAWQSASAADNEPPQLFAVVCADREKSIYRWSSPGATADAP